jgi:glycerol-3-phosphate dehydrogenase subunit C
MHDHIELSLEQSLDYCIKCNICTAACPVSAVTDLFPGPKYVGPQAQRFRKDGQPSPDESVDYCSGCRVCNDVCPTGVRIMELNARARARIVEQKGLPFRSRLLGHQDWTGWLACGPQAALANFAAGNPLLRFAAEKMVGIARKAPLPKFSAYSFRSWFKRRGLGAKGLRLTRLTRWGFGSGRAAPENSLFRPCGAISSPRTGENRQIAEGLQPSAPPGTMRPRKSWRLRRSSSNLEPATPSPRQVVYFHGCSTNYYEPRVGKAAVAVLERNGFEVILPKQGCCGLPLLSNGAFKQGRKYHEYNLQQLLPYAQRGIPIVGTSTSCTLTLKEEAPELLGMHDTAARLVAEHTYDIFEFLRMLHERGELNTDFKPIDQSLPYHAPCQLRAHGIGRPALDILELVPGLRLNESDAACCGLAGSYGYKAERYQIAMDVGADLFDFIRTSGSDLAICDSEICRWQIAHGAGVAMKHPIEILCEAYG